MIRHIVGHNSEGQPIYYLTLTPEELADLEAHQTEEQKKQTSWEEQQRLTLNGQEGGNKVILEVDKLGPKASVHPSIGTKCPACHSPFEEGDYTTLITLGPGDDPGAMQRAREGRPYNAVAVEVHWSCATGETQ